MSDSSHDLKVGDFSLTILIWNWSDEVQEKLFSFKLQSMQDAQTRCIENKFRTLYNENERENIFMSNLIIIILSIIKSMECNNIL